jgi:glycosyltransferase involved in cell wall biosynthesis
MTQRMTAPPSAPREAARDRPFTSAPLTRSLRVALMIEVDGPGGAEQMLLHLGGALRDRGHSVLPVLPSEGEGWLGARCMEAGMPPAYFTLRSPVDPMCLRGLVSLLRRNGTDVVHSHEFTMAVYGTAATRLLRTPHVITLHGGRYFEAKRRRRTSLRWACRRSRSVTVSSAARDVYARSLGLAADSISVIPNGVPVRSGDGARVRSELRLRPDELLLVAIGNLYPVKGHAILLQALGQLAVRDPDCPWRVAIAGRGEEESALTALATDLGLGDRVHLLGYRPDVEDILTAADVFVMPSLSEGMPLALLEAMFASKPVVASEVGGIPEVVRHGREALLVAPGDPASLRQAIESVLSDARLREELGANAKRRAENRYTVSAMTDAYEDLYVRAVV